MIETDLRTSVHERMRQSALFCRELKRLAVKLVTFIDTAALTSQQLVVIQNQLVQVRTSFLGWPFGSLSDLPVRQRYLAEWPGRWADAAAVLTDLQAIGTRFAELQSASEDLLIIARASGQLVNADPTTGLTTSPVLTAPDTAALRTTAIAVRDSMSGAV